MKLYSALSLSVLAGLVGMPAMAAEFSQAPVPKGITSGGLVYLPNANSDPATGMKPNYVAPFTSVTPVHNQWIVSEHAIVRTGPSRWLLVSMEQNHRMLIEAGWVEAFNFVEWQSGFPATPKLPDAELGYWRGDTPTTHRYVWAPFVYEEAGTWYMYYPAPWPDPTGPLSCFLATSTTGDADPAAWNQYDPDPGTAEIEPLFTPDTERGFRDFQIVKVPLEGGGHEYYNYYIADVFDPNVENSAGGMGNWVSQVQMRKSTSLTSWPASGIQPQTVFRKINTGITSPDRYLVDYENQFVVRYDAENWYMFISRHGLIPADANTNPNWQAIPLATEVYWSPDGLTFSPDHQLPNLRTSTGEEINSAEIFEENGRWFASDAAYSNNLAHWSFESCPDGSGGFTCYSPSFIRQVQSFDESEHSLKVVEIEFQAPTSVGQTWTLY